MRIDKQNSETKEQTNKKCLHLHKKRNVVVVIALSTTTPIYTCVTEAERTAAYTCGAATTTVLTMTTTYIEIYGYPSIEITKI
jgi:hypothetical protein